MKAFTQGHPPEDYRNPEIKSPKYGWRVTQLTRSGSFGHGDQCANKLSQALRKSACNQRLHSALKPSSDDHRLGKGIDPALTLKWGLGSP